MKPTQQEIIELAREAGIVFDERAMPYYARLVHLALERFGAGGGEPVAWMGIGKISKTPQIVAFSQQTVQEHGVNVEIVPLCTHPSPTDLLERFGAGGGEPPFLVNPSDSEMAFECVALPPRTSLYTHPSPTDLRAEYLRGLDDAAEVCKRLAERYGDYALQQPDESESRSRCFASSRSAITYIDAIEALKGKQ